MSNGAPTPPAVTPAPGVTPTPPAATTAAPTQPEAPRPPSTVAAPTQPVAPRPPSTVATPTPPATKPAESDDDDEIVFAGRAGGAFQLTVKDSSDLELGTDKGVVQVGSRVIDQVTRWTNKDVRGQLPIDVKLGGATVTVTSADGEAKATTVLPKAPEVKKAKKGK